MSGMMQRKVGIIYFINYVFRGNRDLSISDEYNIKLLQINFERRALQGCLAPYHGRGSDIRNHSYEYPKMAEAVLGRIRFGWIYPCYHYHFPSTPMCYIS